MRTTWLLRIGMAVIWLSEGLGPKVFFPVDSEIAVVAASGLSWGEPARFLAGLGIAQAISGILALLLRGRLLAILLFAQVAALMILPLLVSLQDPSLWLHPFGPMTKNLPIIVGTGLLARRFWLRR